MKDSLPVWAVERTSFKVVLNDFDSRFEIPRCFQAQFFSESHTAYNTADAMQNTFNSWNLTLENQMYLTTDNGANIVKTAWDLGLCISSVV